MDAPLYRWGMAFVTRRTHRVYSERIGTIITVMKAKHDKPPRCIAECKVPELPSSLEADAVTCQYDRACPK